MNAYRRSWGWVVSDSENAARSWPRSEGPYIEQDEISAVIFDDLPRTEHGVTVPHNWMILEFVK